MDYAFIPLAPGPHAAEPLDVQCPHSARTVPAQCPHSARDSARCKKWYFGNLGSKSRIIGSENLLFRSLILKTVVFASGHCAGTVAGTVRALCGHCAGTVQEAWPCRIGYMIRYSLDHFLGLPERIATYSPSWAVGLPMQQSSSPLGPMSCSAQVLFFTPRDGMWRHLEVKKAVHTREEKAGIRCVTPPSSRIQCWVAKFSKPAGKKSEQTLKQH